MSLIQSFSIFLYDVSEAIVESWGSLKAVISNKVSFKEAATPDTTGITEKIIFIKPVVPPPGATSNKNCSH